MQLRDLVCEGRAAFPPTWQDPHTGAEPLRHEPLAGILVEVEWGRHNLSLELTNYWRGRRLRGRLLTDDATVLPRVHAMLTACIPRHLDELVEMEIPAPAPPSPARSAPAPAEAPAEPVRQAPRPERESATLPLHPDVALLVATLIRKGLLSADDIEATRRTLADAPTPAAAPAARPRPISPLAARLPALLEAADADPSGTVRLVPRK
jgi:hypothetical protein